MSTAKTTTDELPTGMKVDEFLSWADGRAGRYELHGGRVYAMSPERAGHAEVKFAVQAELKRAIAVRGISCHMLPDGMTVRIDDNTAYEPDALLYCGTKIGADVVEVANPLVVVEVLSPSTRKIDASAKLAGYFQVPSIQHYVIVDPDRRRTILHSRAANGTILTRLVATDDLLLEPPGITLEVVRFFS